MNNTSPWAAALRGIVTQPARGVVGLVDDLLALCREHGLALDWQAGHSRVRSRAGDWHELTDVTLRPSVFRAMLARLAELCNEHSPGACSPYGGEGEIAAGTGPAARFRVVFVNTPDEQRFELMRQDTVRAGHPMLGALLANVPRLRHEFLAVWTVSHLVPALQAIHEDATDAEVATALSGVRQVLEGRADTDSWLGDVARLSSGDYAGEPRAIASASTLKLREELPPDRIRNRTIVEQARALVGELLPAPVPPEKRETAPPRSQPDAQR